MAYVRGYTTSSNILKDLAEQLTTGAFGFDPSDNLGLITPVDTSSITDSFIMNVRPLIDRRWVKKEINTVELETEDFDVDVGKVYLNHTLAKGGSTRVELVEGARRIPLYLNPEGGGPSELGYTISEDRTAIYVVKELVDKDLAIDYERTESDRKDYFIKFSKPELTYDDKENNYYIEWEVSGEFDAINDDLVVELRSNKGRINFFKQTEESEQYAKSWLPIEYFISFDKSCIAGVIMGDPSISTDLYVSTPFYFGALKQLEGALTTDDKGNFAAFSGGVDAPEILNTFGDNTGNGTTDVVMVTTKGGAPFFSHQAHIFGCGDYSEFLLSGISSHTHKHAVSEVVITSKSENDRGTLRRCIAVPKASKEHGSELIYNRYIGGKEERFIFLHINTPYMPFGTSQGEFDGEGTIEPENLVGFAIRIDS